MPLYMNRLTIITIIASIFTVIAGIYHLKIVPSNNVNATILLYLGSIVSGVAVGIGFHFLFKRIQWL